MTDDGQLQGQTYNTPRSQPCSLRKTGYALLLLFACAAPLIGNIYDGKRDLFGFDTYPIFWWQIAYAVGFIGYACLMLAFRRQPPRLRIILIAAVALRLPLLLSPPNSDVNRYMWEGKLQLEGLSPYMVSPQDPRAAHLHDEIHGGINHPHYPTIYPPLSQLFFRAMATVSYDLKTAQVVFTLLDLCVLLLLAKVLAAVHRPIWLVSYYAFCPIVLAAFAHAGHNDTLMLLPLLGFVLFGTKERWSLAGFCLGLAILAKTTPAVLLAVLAFRSWKGLIIAGFTVVAGYAIYIEAGPKLFEVLFAFSGDGALNNPFDALRQLIEEFGGPKTYLSDRNKVAAVVLLLAAGYIARRRKPLVDATYELLLVTVLLLPIIHFWYLTWPFALAVLAQRHRWAWMTLTGTIVLYWYADLAGQMEAAGVPGMKWQLPDEVVLIIWVPLALAFLIDAKQSKTKQLAA